MTSISPDKITLQFRPEWRLTVFTLLLFPLMISLGFWQLQRAEEKRQIQARLEQARQQDPIEIAELRQQALGLAYRPVKLEGHFLTDRVIFIDNRLWAGKFGYEVVVPFVLLEDNLTILVNRGWVPGDPARRSQPEIIVPAERLVLTGHIYVPPDEAYILGEQQIDDWPTVLQALDMALIADALNRELFPYSVRLEKDTVAALMVDWKTVNQQPQKHTAYAVQWFSMALVLALIYFWHSSNIGQLLQRNKN